MYVSPVFKIKPEGKR